MCEGNCQARYGRLNWARFLLLKTFHVNDSDAIPQRLCILKIFTTGSPFVLKTNVKKLLFFSLFTLLEIQG